MEVTRAIYEKQRFPRFGAANPERMDVSFWKFMIENKETASWARHYFDMQGSPVWCFHRFGMSQDILLDERIICIGGEHEDFYDPDFYIYNDVIVFHPNGDIAIYGYPRDIFPPTDFHSTTLVGNQIYIIGSLGYRDERKSDFTPVYRLNCDSYVIERLETTGDNPGWISEHQAELDIQAGKILIRGGKLADETKYEDSFQAYQLDLATLSWQKLDF